MFIDITIKSTQLPNYLPIIFVYTAITDDFTHKYTLPISTFKRRYNTDVATIECYKSNTIL